MHIIPYYLTSRSTASTASTASNGFGMWTAWIFMRNGGKDIWETDEKGVVPNKTIVKNYLTENGFLGTVTCVKENVMYFKVDPAAMKMGDFYKLTDFTAAAKPVPETVDIWRPFFWVGNDLGADDEYYWKDEVVQMGQMSHTGQLGFLDSFWKVLRDTAN